MTSLCDATVGIAIALGGGGLLLAAILHLSAPIVVYAPSPSALVGARAVLPSSARHRPEAGPAIGRHVPTRPARPRSQTPKPTYPVAAHPLAARPAHSARAAPPPPPAPARPRPAFRVEARPPAVARPPGRAPATVTRVGRPPSLGSASVRRAPVVGARHKSAPPAAKQVAHRARGGVRRPRPRFDTRPKLVEAPFAAGDAATSSESKGLESDARFTGIRVRGRALPVPNTLQTPAPTPFP